ncbi:MAG: phosphonatase-like hydrolase [Burkholderiales bacterium]
MNAIKLVVADMAGTTVKDSGDVAHAFAAALEGHGIEAPAAQINAVRGASKREAIATLIAPKYGSDITRSDAVYASFKDHLRTLFTRAAEPIPGALATFDWLRGRGIKIALNTGFDRDIADLLIDALNWRRVVDALICGDDVPQGRPAPYLIFRAMEATATIDVGHVLNIGDTVSDLKAARNAGVAVSVGVLSGAHRRHQLEAEPHTTLIESIAELPGLWR